MMNQEEIIRKESVCTKSSSVQSHEEVISEENIVTKSSNRMPMDSSDSDLRLKLYKSKVNGIVSQALGKQAPVKNSEEKEEDHPNDPETELRLRMYRARVREIVAKALGKQLPVDNEGDTSNEFENKEEIKTQSRVVVSSKSVKEESTIMTVESTEIINSSKQ